jgi:hypothetical protein
MPITPNRTRAISLITVTLVLLTLSSLAAYGGEPLGFGGVSLGDSEAEVLSVFPDADCRYAPELKPPYRCFVKALAWGGVPTGAWFIFEGAERNRSLRSIVLVFSPELYREVLPRLVLDYGQATEQRGATLFWKIGRSGVVLRDRGKGQPFQVFMTTDAAIDRPIR